MARRVGERDAILVEIVGDRELAAEGVATARDVDLVDLVIAGLQQDRHAEAGIVDKFRDGDLVAEVRQADDEAVNDVALRPEMGGVAATVLARLHGAVLRRLDRQDGEATLSLSSCAMSCSARSPAPARR